jgi:outer membrane protein OmpA-like peptidoglycan-associated protein
MCVLALSVSANLFADDHLRGVISGRADDGSLMVQADGAVPTPTTLVIDDATKIKQSNGRRSATLASTVLMPGLRIKAEGHFDTPGRFAAKEVTFTKADWTIVQAIWNGLMPIDARVRANEQRLDQQAQALQQHGATLAQQGQQIETQSGLISSANQKITATAGSVDAAIARINNLDDYNVIETITVYFQNGKASLSPKYRQELQEFAARAKNVEGYAVQVQGFASTPGSHNLNDRLSMMRADAVTAVLQQSGVTLTNVVVPAAMGETEPVATNKTKQGQAENRRAVVKLLQNKGISNK